MERKKILKILLYYFILANYKLVNNYEDIKVILQKKKKLKTLQEYKSNFLDLEGK